MATIIVNDTTGVVRFAITDLSFPPAVDVRPDGIYYDRRLILEWGEDVSVYTETLPGDYADNRYIYSPSGGFEPNPAGEPLTIPERLQALDDQITLLENN